VDGPTALTDEEPHSEHELGFGRRAHDRDGADGALLY